MPTESISKWLSMVKYSEYSAVWSNYEINSMLFWLMKNSICHQQPYQTNKWNGNSWFNNILKQNEVAPVRFRINSECLTFKLIIDYVESSIRTLVLFPAFHSLNGIIYILLSAKCTEATKDFLFVHKNSITILIRLLPLDRILLCFSSLFVNMNIFWELGESWREKKKHASSIITSRVWIERAFQLGKLAWSK